MLHHYQVYSYVPLSMQSLVAYLIKEGIEARAARWRVCTPHPRRRPICVNQLHREPPRT